MFNYEINKETLIILPFEKKHSKIIENDNEFIVYQSPTKIIDNSCRFFGSSYEGRFEGTKHLLGFSRKAPIIIEESKSIIFFPTTSPRLDNCIWISLNNIENYYKKDNHTIIIFSTGKKVKIDLSFNIFENQLLRATRLESILRKRREKIEEIVK